MTITIIQILRIAMLLMMMMMIMMTMEMKYVEDTIILDDQQQYQIIMMKNYFADTTISKHCLTAKKNYFIGIMTLEHLCFETYCSHQPCH